MEGIIPGTPDPRSRTPIALHRWSILTITVAGAWLALALSFQKAPVYSSHARVLVGSQPSQTSSVADRVSLETERELAGSRAVAVIAADRLPADNIDDPQELLVGLSIDVIADTEILEFSYTHSLPETAQERAQAFADAYLLARYRDRQRAAAAQAESVDEEVAYLDRRLGLINVRIHATRDDSRLAHLEAQATTVLNLVLEKELKLASLSDVAPVGEIVEPAYLPSAPSGPNHLVNGVVGMVLGLVAGVGYAGLRFRRDDRILSPEELEAALGAPVLGTIPRLKGVRRRSRLVAGPKGSPRNVDAYQILGTNVLAAVEARAARTIVVTSARPGEGKSVTAANLALVIARSGKRVVLMSADTRNDRLGRLMGLPMSPGLTDVLARNLRLEQALVPMGQHGFEVRTLVVLPAGHIRGDPAPLLGSQAMVDVLAAITGQAGADLIVIDAAPVLGMADTLALAPLADALLLVVDGRRATHAAVGRVRKQLNQVNASVLGAILNRPRARSTSSFVANR